jgi:hypothetical protein
VVAVGFPIRVRAAHVASVQFLRADLRLGHTFLTLALREQTAAPRARLSAKAQAAHDAVMRLLTLMPVTEDERVEIEIGLTSLARAIAEV